jgi:lysozyme
MKTYNIPPQALELVQRFEGFSAKPYRCPAGHLTIGWGHMLREGEIFPAEGIDSDRATGLLLADMQEAARAVTRLITAPLNENRLSALLSFTFNLGAGALQRSTLRRKVNRGESNDIPKEFSKWVWAGGRKLPGLIARRTAEARLYISEEMS